MPDARPVVIRAQAGTPPPVPATPGMDRIFNSRHMVHREVTPPGEASELFGVRMGSGPQNFNVDGPDSG